MDNSRATTVRQYFQQEFSTEPILVFSPGRINLIGEHTDYNDGFAFPAAVDKGIYMAVGKSYNSHSKAIALDVSEDFEFTLNNIEPIQNGGWRNYIIGVVAEIQKEGIIIPNFNCAFSGDIPVGSGMSSSAALENSVVFALNELFELGLSKNQMIYISQRAEHNYAGVKCGIMDQYASMFGQENSALLLDCRSVTSDAFEIDFKDYELMLINSNVKHALTDSAYNDRRAICEKISAFLDISALRDISIEALEKSKNDITTSDYRKVSYVVEEIDRVHQFKGAIGTNDLTKIGSLIYASHEGLSQKYQVSCEELDFLVDATKSNQNILGARMMGGGFGGCTINLIHKNEIESFSELICDLYRKEFEKECSIYRVKLSQGTHRI
ncbi:MAG: galactokinase [Polaribacter sp.]|jgi:galactokinase